MSAPAERHLTGRQVLIWVLAFFGVVTLVNAIMVWLALTTHHEVIKRTVTMDRAPAVERESASWPT